LAKGAEVIFQDAHVSGHACREEIKLIYTLVRPKYAIPVHGEYKHLIAQARLAEELGIPHENVFILNSGDVLELNDEGAAVTGKVQVGAVLVDGLGIGDVGNAVLRDRQILAENGIIMAVMAIESVTGMLVSGPQLVTRGFIYVKESDAVMDEMREIVQLAVERLSDRGIHDHNKIRNTVRDELSSYIWKSMNRRPMILPVILEV
jgi:ribonuclease J